MIWKGTTIALGTTLLATGASLDIGVPAGATGGNIGFAVGAIASLYWLYQKGMKQGKTPTDLWIIIFYGLAIEALVFPVAVAIKLVTSPYMNEPGLVKTAVISYGAVGVLLAAVFFFNARMLNGKLRYLHARLEAEKKKKEPENVKHEK